MTVALSSSGFLFTNSRAAKTGPMVCELDGPTPILYILCEVIRCGGNFKLRGAEKPYEIEFKCPDGFVEFKLGAKK